MSIWTQCRLRFSSQPHPRHEFDVDSTHFPCYRLCTAYTNDAYHQRRLDPSTGSRLLTMDLPDSKAGNEKTENLRTHFAGRLDPSFRRRRQYALWRLDRPLSNPD